MKHVITAFTFALLSMFSTASFSLEASQRVENARSVVASMKASILKRRKALIFLNPNSPSTPRAKCIYRDELLEDYKRLAKLQAIIASYNLNGDKLFWDGYEESLWDEYEESIDYVAYYTSLLDRNCIQYNLSVFTK